MKEISLIKHSKGALGLRFFGLGPNLKPTNGLIKLQKLLDTNTLWAKSRTRDVNCYACATSAKRQAKGNCRERNVFQATRRHQCVDSSCIQITEAKRKRLEAERLILSLHS